MGHHHFNDGPSPYIQLVKAKYKINPRHFNICFLLGHVLDKVCFVFLREKYILKRHINNAHEGIRDFECDICHEKFFRADTRDNHRDRHFEAFLKCLYCNKMFKGQLDRRKHELTHTGEKQFFCPTCNQGFTQLWPYYQHMWRIHQITKEEAKEMRVKNPNIVKMRDKNEKDRSLISHNTARDRKARSKACSGPVVTRQLRKVTRYDPPTTVVFSEVDGAEMQEAMEGAAELVEFTGETSDLTSTIVLNMKDDSVDGTNETIVIQGVDGEKQFIMLDSHNENHNIVLLPEYTE